MYQDEAWTAAPGYTFWSSGVFGTRLFAGFYGMESGKRPGREGLAIAETTMKVTSLVPTMAVYSVPVLGILLVTSEWGQRAALNTFTLSSLDRGTKGWRSRKSSVLSFGRRMSR